MINRIIGSFIFISCLFALLLALSGVTAPVWFGNEFRSFIVTTNLELSSYHIAIPNIPLIPNIGFLDFSDNVGANIIVLFSNFFNALAIFINALITLLNGIILFINTVINLVSFLLIFLKNILTMRDSIVALQ